MKIVCISDTHEYHDKVLVPDGDVLIHAGDITFAGKRDIIASFNDWLGGLPHAHKLVIAGNHDFNMEQNAALLTNATYLQDTEVLINGYKFYGSPFAPRFGHWAFMLDRGQPILQKWLAIPHDTDVLITHGPPYGTLDTPVPEGEHLGCEDLMHVVNAQPPRLHVFGHIHGGYGKKECTTTTFVNAAVCNEQYKPVNAPVEIEI